MMSRSRLLCPRLRLSNSRKLAEKQTVSQLRLSPGAESGESTSQPVNLSHRLCPPDEENTGGLWDRFEEVLRSSVGTVWARDAN
jgi:hypothetical protein